MTFELTGSFLTSDMLAPILECRAFVSGIYTFGSSMFSLSMCSLPHVYTLYSNDWPLVLGPIWNFHIDVKFTVRFIPVITRPLKVQSLMNRFFFSAAFPGAINISSPFHEKVKELFCQPL